MRSPDNIQEAQKIQRKLARRIHIAPLKKRPACIAGADASFSGSRVIGTACLFSYPGLEHLESTHAITLSLFPYIPGFLSFREGPALLSALRKLKTAPDLILFDGQGIAHPKRMGIATHLGILLGIPSVGCAKSRLIGKYQQPAATKGSFTLLKHKGMTIGAVVRTRDRVKPVFVSPGHMIDVRKAVDVVLNCTGRYRIPEPLRSADRLSKEIQKNLR